MANTQELLRQAMQSHENGDLSAAKQYYQEVATADKKRVEPELYLGVIACQEKDFPEAIRHFAKAQAMGCDSPVLHINYGLALLENNDTSMAESYFSRGADLLPESADAFFNLGRCQLRLLKFHMAANSFNQSLSLNPNDSQAWTNLGLSLIGSNAPQQAIEALEKACNLSGETANIRTHLGRAFEKLENYTLATDNYQRACDLSPENLSAQLGLARVCALTGDFSQAFTICHNQAQRNPDSCEVQCVWTTTLILAGKLTDALEHATTALKLSTQSAEVHGLLGYLYNKFGDTTKAEEHLLQAITLSPENAANYLNRANNLIAQGRVFEALECSQSCLQLQPTNYSAFSNILLHMHYPSGIDQQEIFSLAKKWNAAYGASHEQQYPARKIDTGKNLRVGFLTGDLRRHSVAFFLQPLLQYLPELQSEIFIYSNNPQDDAITEHLKGYCNSWRDIRQLSDSTAREMIADDKIDILIELSGHTDNNRLKLFASHPAPIQVSWLGYPDSTGIAGNVYRIVDNITDNEQAQQYCSERLVFMPGPFICYSPAADYPSISQNASSAPVFGSFNALAKISDFTLQLWSEILKRSPSATLLLKSRGLDDKQTRENLLKRLKSFSIDQNRVNLLPMESNYNSHLNIYNSIDVALDTFPYNGTTTTCEALLMGRPVITLLGDFHHSRVSSSILVASGLPQYIAQTPDEYINNALQATQTDQTQLETNRKTFLNASICNQQDFAARYRQALQKIVTDYNGK